MESRAMKHAADIDLIELAAGRLPPERRTILQPARRAGSASPPSPGRGTRWARGR